MRCLLPNRDDHIDLHAHYADGWLDQGGVRANMVSSVDGAGTVDGLSEGLQTAGDNSVFATLRDLADVVLVGAGTAVAEKYRPVHLSQRRSDLRRDLGLAPTLPLAIVSRSLHVDPAAPLFTAVDTAARTLVFTVEAADPAIKASLHNVAEVVECGEAEVDLSAAVEVLRTRGMTRVLSEGGPSLLASLADAGVLDELCVSLTPILAGPGASRIVRGSPWPAPRAGMSLVGLLEEDGALFARYAARGRQSEVRCA
jgi:riboflavin biosynthesis pyrimidine reductase